MARKITVSIVVPFFNAQRFLRDTVESVLSQTFEDWELLLIDDGSTDHSCDIARQYAADFPDRVSYLEHAGHANQGTAFTRNFGITRSRGEYITPLDADDVWLPEKLEQQVDILDKNSDVALVYGG